jgi:VIT1/CCC1 family predicted Fe2+/Mn2+ transporter
MIARLIGRVRELAAPAVFGAFDGLTCALGVLLPLLAAGDPHLAFRASLGVGLAEAVGMAAGSWLSSSGDGLAGSAVIGVATGLGAVLPAVPLVLWPSDTGRAGALVIVAALAVLIGIVRAHGTGRGRWRALAETAAVLLLAAAAVLGGMYISGS